MSYQIKIPSCIFGGAGSIENVKAVIETEKMCIRDSYILDKTTAGDEFQNISVLLIGCLMFYAVYYISMISEIKKIECELNESGIFGGRGMGILINMFSLQYIFELYKKPLVCIVLIVVSVIVLILSRKYIKSVSYTHLDVYKRQG